mmetsp:Transcript_48176/g.94114  ORF Transcript_48176/g.94114 Transcript_48176/m.94114 type:complete len:361 (-) Transcript_48176:1254-2336(-)
MSRSIEYWVAFFILVGSLFEEGDFFEEPNFFSVFLLLRVFRASLGVQIIRRSVIPLIVQHTVPFIVHFLEFFLFLIYFVLQNMNVFRHFIQLQILQDLGGEDLLILLYVELPRGAVCIHIGSVAGYLFLVVRLRQYVGHFLGLFFVVDRNVLLEILARMCIFLKFGDFGVFHTFIFGDLGDFNPVIGFMLGLGYYFAHFFHFCIRAIRFVFYCRGMCAAVPSFENFTQAIIFTRDVFFHRSEGDTAVFPISFGSVHNIFTRQNTLEALFLQHRGDHGDIIVAVVHHAHVVLVFEEDVPAGIVADQQLVAVRIQFHFEFIFVGRAHRLLIDDGSCRCTRLWCSSSQIFLTFIVHGFERTIR